MNAFSPPGTVHALDLDRLRTPDIRFWTAWRGDVLLGCGALRRIEADHGEVKSMRTHPDHLRQGVAARLLETIIAAARADGLARLSLETRSGPAFQPALDFYARFGFVACGRFGDYPGDPFSRFLRLEL